MVFKNEAVQLFAFLGEILPLQGEIAPKLNENNTF